MPRMLRRQFSFDKPYKGVGGERGDVVGTVEVIASPILLDGRQTTKASEAPSQKECDEFMTDSEVDKKSKKLTGMEHKSIRGFFPKRV